MIVRAPNVCSLLDTGPVVRYRFDSRAELDRHLRLDGFFVPTTRLPDGRVVIELAFSGCDDGRLLHARVRSRSGDGVWLEAPSARAAARWIPGPDSPRRRGRRLACDLLVEVRPRGALPWLCRALDLSEGGVRLATGSFETGVAGDEVELTLLAGAAIDLPARLSWAGSREAGLELRAPPPELADLVRALESRSTDVQEVLHPPDCACKAPPLRAG